MVGLSDEAGAGGNVGLAMKAACAPTAAEAARLDEYIERTLYGVTAEIPFPVSLQASGCCWSLLVSWQICRRASRGTVSVTGLPAAAECRIQTRVASAPRSSGCPPRCVVSLANTRPLSKPLKEFQLQAACTAET